MIEGIILGVALVIIGLGSAAVEGKTPYISFGFVVGGIWLIVHAIRHW